MEATKARLFYGYPDWALLGLEGMQPSREKAALAAAGPFLLFALRDPEVAMGASNVQILADAHPWQDAGAVVSALLLVVRALHAISAYFAGIQRDSVDGNGI